MTRTCALLLAALVLSGLSACTAKDEPVVALLLPDRNAARWESSDGPAFEQAVEAACPDCVVRIYNAEGVAATQLAQLTTAKDDGADVLVLVAVDSAAGADAVQAAGRTPVVAYDRFVEGADYYVSFDGSRVGELQAEAVLEAPARRPRILMLNGAVGDPNATALKEAAHSVLDKAQVKLLAEGDPQDWTAATAKTWVSDQLKSLGDQRIDAVYAANDTQAEGVAEALADADRTVSVITGQDAELGALQRIIEGRQTMTVYKPIPAAADRAARISVNLLAGNQVRLPEEVDGVPSVIFDPVAVTIANLTDTVVRDGVTTIDQLCTPEMLEACEAQGIA